MRQLMYRLAALNALLLISACSGKPPEVPPVLSLDGRQCAARPDLSAARPLEPPERQRSGSAVVIDAAAPCWNNGMGNAAYVVFALPSVTSPYMVRVSSTPQGRSVLMPRLLFLNERGDTLREMGRQEMQFRQGSLSAVARAQPGMRYLVVSSDPQNVGERHTRIVASTSITAVPIPMGAINVYSGQETQEQFQGSHNGTVSVALLPMTATR